MSLARSLARPLASPLASALVRGGGGLAAPTLAVDTPVTNPPTFTATLTPSAAGILEGDSVRLQIHTSTDFSSPTYNQTSTLDASDVAAEEETGFPAPSPALDGGSYYARARQERGGLVSPWSEVVGPFAVPSSYTEQGVVFDGINDVMARNSGLSGVANGKTGLFFVSVEFDSVAAADFEALIYIDDTTNDIAIQRNTSGKLYLIAGGTSSEVINAAGPTTIGAERCNILVALDSEGPSYAYAWTSGGGWAQEISDATGGSIDFNFNSDSGVRVGARYIGNRVFGGTLYRLAAWFNPTSLPDITDSAVRDNFADSSTGETVDPATSVSAYGTPDIDIHGDAAAFNGGTANNGTAGAFTMINGSVADA